MEEAEEEVEKEVDDDGHGVNAIPLKPGEVYVHLYSRRRRSIAPRSDNAVCRGEPRRRGGNGYQCRSVRKIELSKIIDRKRRECIEEEEEKS